MINLQVISRTDAPQGAGYIETQRNDALPWETIKVFPNILVALRSVMDFVHKGSLDTKYQYYRLAGVDGSHL